ncbi:MAG: glycosyltransferase family 4 protein [Gammaproteobacteria bacterium]
MKQRKPGKEQFKLLYITYETFPTFRVDLTQLFSAELAGRGHSIDWVMRSQHAGPNRLEQISPTERVFVGVARPGQGLWDRVRNQLYALIHDVRIWGIVRRGDYDFIQVRDKFFASLVGLAAARAKGIPFFYWMSFPYPEADLLRASEDKDTLPRFNRYFYYARGFLTSLILYKIILPHADHVFVQSDQMKKEVAEHAIAEDKMTPVPMGVNLALIDPERIQRSSDGRLAGKLPVVYAGTLIKARRMDFLIQAFKTVVERVPNAVLVLVGDADADDMQFLYNTAEELGLRDSVIFTGFIPMDQAWGYIRSASLCVSPFRPCQTLNSASPTKLVEYMAWGKPVVANDHPDQGKVLSESGAGLAVPYDPAAFANAIVELLTDAPRSEEMGERGKDYVLKYRSYTPLAELVERTYQRLLDVR